MADWGYSKKDGPSTWAEIAPAGKGTHQSPINITTDKAEFDETLLDKPLKWKYDPTKAQSLTNNGHSAQVAYNDGGSCLEGGPLAPKTKYEIKQFHLHWGKDDNSGSEHTINGKMYASELHLVHWNTTDYPSFGEAAQRKDGLCVLGIFLKVGKEHKELKKMTDLLSKVSHGGETHEQNFPAIDPAALLPGNTSDYWTYPGSLTTPPLYESVTWVVFKEPIEVSEEQMKSFRALHEDKRGESLKGHIVDNYRPPQPLGDRQVRSTMK